MIHIQDLKAAQAMKEIDFTESDMIDEETATKKIQSFTKLKDSKLRTINAFYDGIFAVAGESGDTSDWKELLSPVMQAYPFVRDIFAGPNDVVFKYYEFLLENVDARNEAMPLMNDGENFDFWFFSYATTFDEKFVNEISNDLDMSQYSSVVDVIDQQVEALGDNPVATLNLKAVNRFMDLNEEEKIVGLPKLGEDK